MPYPVASYPDRFNEVPNGQTELQLCKTTAGSCQKEEKEEKQARKAAAGGSPKEDESEDGEPETTDAAPPSE